MDGEGVDSRFGKERRKVEGEKTVLVMEWKKNEKMLIKIKKIQVYCLCWKAFPFIKASFIKQF